MVLLQKYYSNLYYLQRANFHSLTVPSSDPGANICPSLEKIKHFIPITGSGTESNNSIFSRLQMVIGPLTLVATNIVPSGEKAKICTLPEFSFKDVIRDPSLVLLKLIEPSRNPKTRYLPFGAKEKLSIS